MGSSRPSRVVPGDPLAVVEEYEPGPGAYVDDRGVVRAAVAGVAVYDDRSRTVSVRPGRQPRLPRPGSEVVALVTNVRHDVVIVDILGEVSLSPVPRFLHEYTSKFPGAVAISNIADEYIEDIHDYYRVGDIILARVLNSNAPYHLTTRAPQYGVVYARCSRCGALLEPEKGRSMRCPRCGHKERRKVSVLANSRLLRLGLKRLLVVPIR